MKTRSNVIGVVVFLTVFFLVLVAGAGAVEIKSKKNPALPGKQASDVITATGSGYTVYYVKNGAIKIKTTFMEEFAKTPVAKFVNESNKKGMSLDDIMTKGQQAGHSPVDLLKGFIINEMPLQAVIKAFLDKNLLPPCGLMKGALEAVRGMKMVEVEAGHYAIVTPGMCAIEGTMDQSDWDRLQKLMAEGLISVEELPHYPPEKEQSVAAGCCETLELAQVFLAAGADIEDLRACFSTMGCSGLGYSAPPPPPPAPATTLGTIEASPTQ
jgi:hypothetical protein